MKRHYAILALALLLAGCGYNDFDRRTPPGDGALPAANTEIASLRALYSGARLDIREDMVVAGRVTTSDRAGNFFRTFVIEDQTGAIEIRAGLYDLHRAYPLGTKVAVRLRGLSVGMDAGVLQAGATPLPSSYNQTEYIGHRAVVGRHVVRGAAGDPVAPLPGTIATLEESDVGRLVTVPELRFAGATPGASGPGTVPVTWGVPSPGDGLAPSAGYRKFKDATDNTLLVVTSGYASFAGSVIPAGELTITGILLYGPVPGTYGSSVYMLKMRDMDDVSY